MRVGLIIIDEHPGAAVEVAMAADKAGVDSIWTIDYYNRSSLARAAAFAAATHSIRVGTSVTPLFARAPIALAAAAIDVQALSRGRFVLGVGSSTRRMNQDWYGVDLDHPAPRAEERIRLLRGLMSHEGGAFSFNGRFESVHMTHYDRNTEPAPPPIMAAGVGARMVQASARVADGFVGHTVASADNLADLAVPAITSTLQAGGRSRAAFTVSSQIIASCDRDTGRARARAALQAAFYSTPKGYDALFSDDESSACRAQAQEAFVAGDIAGVQQAGLGLTHDRSVFGTPDDISEQLTRYEEILDLALLYPPYFRVEPEEVTKNEHALIDVAAQWTNR